MARVNITIPDELLGRARSERLPVSAVAAAAVAWAADLDSSGPDGPLSSGRPA